MQLDAAPSGPCFWAPVAACCSALGSCPLRVWPLLLFAQAMMGANKVKVGGWLLLSPKFKGALREACTGIFHRYPGGGDVVCMPWSLVLCGLWMVCLAQRSHAYFVEIPSADFLMRVCTRQDTPSPNAQLLREASSAHSLVRGGEGG